MKTIVVTITPSIISIKVRIMELPELNSVLFEVIYNTLCLLNLSPIIDYLYHFTFSFKELREH